MRQAEIEKMKIYFGFYYTTDKIKYINGWKDSKNPFGLMSEHSVLEDIMLDGSDKDFILLLKNMNKEMKSPEERLKKVGFILTAQNNWTKRDKMFFETFYDSEYLFKAIRHSIYILWILSLKSSKRNKKMNKLNRRNGLPRTIKETEVELLFVKKIGKMLSILSLLIKKEDFEIYEKISTWTAKEILRSPFFKTEN